MIDLLNTTFIIPIRIEHQDRYNNAKMTLTYLNEHLKTNVFIYEVSDDGDTKLDFLKNLTNLNVSIINDKFDGVFHRMKYLNILLNYVETPVVCNYDIDVVLLPNVYSIAQSSILSKEFDLFYPYGWGSYQYHVEKEFGLNKFLKELDLTKIDNKYLRIGGSEFGHCMFFNTKVYRKEGGENENFISWGHEDKERGIRFIKLGYKVKWGEHFVYHFEHDRLQDSNKTNPYFQSNINLFKVLDQMNKNELIEYYKNQDYIKQYDNFLYSE